MTLAKILKVRHDVLGPLHVNQLDIGQVRKARRVVHGPLEASTPKVRQDAALPRLRGLHALHNNGFIPSPVDSADDETCKPNLRLAWVRSVMVNNEVIPRLAVQILGCPNVLLLPSRPPAENRLKLSRVGDQEMLMLADAKEIR